LDLRFLAVSVTVRVLFVKGLGPRMVRAS